MSHITVTQSQPIPMPRQSGLLERRGRFYLNMRVPKELRSLYGKKEVIRKSLNASDRSEAISRVRYEAFKLDAEFKAKERELKLVFSPVKRDSKGPRRYEFPLILAACSKPDPHAEDCRPLPSDALPSQ